MNFWMSINYSKNGQFLIDRVDDLMFDSSSNANESGNRHSTTSSSSSNSNSANDMAFKH